jgi:hypothetical protein
MMWDLNVWDRGLYNTAHLPESEQVSEWKINFYETTFDGTYYNRGEMIDKLDYALNENEVAILGLRGNGEWFDGAQDSFIYSEDFVNNFTIPRKLRRHLEGVGIAVA